MSVDMISISPANMQKQTWKVCISNPFTNCERIYPIQQSGVRILIDYLAKNPNVEKLPYLDLVLDRIAILEVILIFTLSCKKTKINLSHELFLLCLIYRQISLWMIKC